MAIRKFFAYAAIYVLWGASFLAIRQVVAVTPPFFAASFRFLCAGAILYGYSCWQGMPLPNRRQWISTAVLGLVMFAADYGCLFWAEKEVPSGLAAVIAATIPVWVLLAEWIVSRSQPPSAKGSGRHRSWGRGGDFAYASRRASSHWFQHIGAGPAAGHVLLVRWERLPAAILTCRGNSA